MSSSSILIAEAVKDSLNGKSFTQAFTAERLYRAINDLKDLKTLKVSVVPRTLGSTVVSRSEFSNLVETDIAIQKKLTLSEFATNTAPDALMNLVQEIIDFFNGLALATLSAAKWISTVSDPIYAPEHYDGFRQFTSVITVAYDLPIERTS